MAQRKPRYTIGLILSNVSSDFSGHLIEQMGASFTQNGYQLIVTCTNHNIAMEREMLKKFSSTTDGIIIISDAVDYDELSDAVPTRIPVIFLNRCPSGCPHTRIIENDYSAVYQSILSNSTRGHDKIALVCGNRDFSTTKEILQAYKDAMSSLPAGFHEDWIYVTDDTNNVSDQLLNKICDDPTFNTVFLCTQTLTRQYLDHLMVYNQNAERPMALIGFVNSDIHSETLFSIDTITQPLQELVELAVQQMLYLINEPKTLAREYLLKGTFRPHSLNGLNVDRNQEDL